MDKRRSRPAHTRGAVCDITAQREAQQELRASAEALLESQAELRCLAAKLILKEQGESRRLAMELKSNLQRRRGSVLAETPKLKASVPVGSRPLPEAIQSFRKNVQRLLSDTRRVSKQLYPFEIEQKGFGTYHSGGTYSTHEQRSNHGVRTAAGDSIACGGAGKRCRRAQGFHDASVPVLTKR
jgi:hypothetical protein